MGRLLFNKCCFCIELKTGCFIIGYLGLIGYAIQTIIYILGIIGGGAILANKDSLNQPTNGFQIEPHFDRSNFNNDNKSREAQDNSAALAGTMMIVISALHLIFVLLFLTFVIVLLVGLHKNKPGHVKAYIIYSIIFIIISLIGLGSIFTSHPRNIADDLVNIAWNVYTTLVIRSQYFAMKSPERGPAIYNTA